VPANFRRQHGIAVGIECLAHLFILRELRAAFEAFPGVLLYLKHLIVAKFTVEPGNELSRIVTH
jgi:hypothetical protein